MKQGQKPELSVGSHHLLCHGHRSANTDQCYPLFRRECSRCPRFVEKHQLDTQAALLPSAGTRSQDAEGRTTDHEKRDQSLGGPLGRQEHSWTPIGQ